MMQPQILAMPMSIEDTGIERNLLMGLVVKAMHVSGFSNIPDLTRNLKLSRGVVHTLLEDMREMALVEFLGIAGDDPASEMRFNLTSKGHGWATDALAQSQYIGPAPVPFEAFCAQVENQNILNERVNQSALSKSLADLVLPDGLVHRLGPAVNSGRSILLYGPPGNGKSCIAEAFGGAFQQSIYVPYCIEVDGQIINFFDEAVHRPVSAPSLSSENTSLLRTKEHIDPRWVHCLRPVVTTGGELTLGMLDLTYNANARFYEAPLQLKATGGVFVIDDFGRQQTKPQDILNRWIIPLERGMDYLTLHTGKKFPVPFNELVVFSTNMSPVELADEATLRRLYYKVEIPIPTRDDYAKIFANICRQYNIELQADTLTYLFESFYAEKNIPLAGYHPKYIVDQVIAMCEYHDIPVSLNPDLIKMACYNLYAT